MESACKVHAKTQNDKSANSISSFRNNASCRSTNSPTEKIMFLQRTAGNQAVQRLIKSGALQAKLRIGQPNDIYEQEADRVAEQVMSMSEPKVQRQAEENNEEEPIQAKPLVDQFTPLVKRQSENEEENEIQKKVYDKKNQKVNFDLWSSIQSLKSKGQPLSKDLLEFFEPRFGYDFSNVRLHMGTEAAFTSQMLNAKAYTVGNDVIFGAGQYAPETSSGKKLLAHELTHVVQQRNSIIQPAQNKPHVLGPKPASSQWEGTPEQKKFREEVLKAAIASKRRKPYRSLKKEMLSRVVGTQGVTMGSDEAAVQAGLFLKAAKTALNMKRTEIELKMNKSRTTKTTSKSGKEIFGADSDARKLADLEKNILSTVDIKISGYRSVEEEELLWLKYFKD